MSSPLGLSTNHEPARPRDTGSPDFEFLLNSKGAVLNPEQCATQPTDMLEEHRSTET
jgi:hypothetical protein